MILHSGLAARSLPFGLDREPPNVVHAFTEPIVIGPAGHEPADDIQPGSITAIRMFGNHSGQVLPEGEDATFTYGGALTDVEKFRDANVLLVNTRSAWRAVMVGLPYGVRVQPLWSATGMRRPSGPGCPLAAGCSARGRIIWRSASADRTGGPDLVLWLLPEVDPWALPDYEIAMTISPRR